MKTKIYIYFIYIQGSLINKNTKNTPASVQILYLDIEKIKTWFWLICVSPSSMRVKKTLRRIFTFKPFFVIVQRLSMLLLKYLTKLAVKKSLPFYVQS